MFCCVVSVTVRIVFESIKLPRPAFTPPPRSTSRWLKLITAGLGAVASGLAAIAIVHYRAEEAKKPRPIGLDQDGRFTNSLGMKFVDVPGTDVLMCIHETRHKDFEAYAAEVPGAIAIWSDGVPRGLDPIVENRAEYPVIRRIQIHSQPEPTETPTSLCISAGFHFRRSAGGGTRTHTPLRIMDFESIASAIPPRRQRGRCPTRRMARRASGQLGFVGGRGGSRAPGRRAPALQGFSR